MISLIHPRRGAALVITLSILVLITVLVLSLFLSVTSERTESAAAANQGDAQRLATGVVDLVKATISQATMGYESDATTGTPNTSSPVAWASQPGLIRTWDTSGNPYRSYRLYSSGNLVTNGALDLTAEFTELSAWKSGSPSGSFNAVWCDLNAPAANVAGRLTYPIVTPPRDDNSGSAATDTVNGVPTDDPATPGQEGVQGFQVQSAPGFSSGAASADNNPAPMPVKWLYVLQDGSYVSPTGNATVATVPGATRENPIVGRVGYWTDDDTSKINVNTASEGVHWDVPIARNSNEAFLGRFQPAQNEFNRYPGHPSMTSLSAVFPDFSFASATDRETIFSIFPRVGWGGSEGGTRQLNPTVGATPTGGGRPPIETDRLFANANEFLFRATPVPRQYNPISGSASQAIDDVKNRSFFLTATSRAPEVNLLNQPRISLWPITTDSVGSSTHTAGTRQDAFDRTLKFTATLNNLDFFFARSDARSSTYDWSIPRNQQIIGYLNRLTSTPVPGYGGSFTGKYGTDDRDALMVQIFDFVRAGPALLRVSDMKANGRMLPGYTLPYDDARVAEPFARMVVPTRTDTSTLDAGYKGMGSFLSITQVGLAFYCEAVEPFDSSGNSTASGGTFSPSTTRVRYTIRPTLLVQTNCPTIAWSRDPMFFNNRFTGDNRSIRFAASLAGSLGAPTLTANASTNNGTGGGTITFPWGSPSELRIRPEPSESWDSSRASFSPFAFILESSNGLGGNATNSQSGENRQTYRSLSPIQLEFTLPLGWASLPENQRSLTRLQALLTKGDGNVGWPVNTVRTEDPPSGWSPRMAFSGMDLMIRLAFTDNGNTIPDADVVHTVLVSFPANDSLPVPSLTARGVNYSVLASGAALPTPEQQLHEASKSLAGRVMNLPSGSSNALRNQPVAGPGDVIRSLEISGTSGFRGDWRLAALTPSLPSATFAPPIPNGASASYTSDDARLHAFTVNFDSMAVRENPIHSARLVSNINFSSGNVGDRTNVRQTSASLNGATMLNGAPGDWNNEAGNAADGATFGLPDLGALGQGVSPNESGPGWPTAVKWSYFNSTLLQNERDALQFSLMYSPNRQLFSPFQMGSLLTEAAEGKPWQTLLFSPVSAAKVSGDAHPGEQSPPDHVLADLFWMPVVDPYPISEPFSTAGKINLNYQIAPFTHITRSTGIHALLRSIKVAALPDSLATGIPNTHYKGSVSGISPSDFPSQQIRFDVDAAETLNGFSQKFSNPKGAFSSPTEIADVFLVPQGRTYSNLQSWWSDKRLTGDNTREAPYAQLLPRVTTKSNTYTIHLRVQSLKQVPGWRTSPTDWGRWDEARDQVLSEYRGSASIERYVDPNDTSIPDFALPANSTKNLAPFYRWRILEERQFIP